MLPLLCNWIEMQRCSPGVQLVDAVVVLRGADVLGAVRFVEIGFGSAITGH